VRVYTSGFIEDRNDAYAIYFGALGSRASFSGFPVALLAEGVGGGCSGGVSRVRN
jgi:hypothetical protein